MSTEVLSLQQRGKNLESVQEMNRASVLRIMMKRSTCSRAEIARELGLKQATITNIINDFLSWGLVVETSLLSGKKGRRSIGVQISQKSFYVIGVRLRRTSYKVGLFDIYGENIVMEKYPYDKKLGPMRVVRMMRESIENMLQAHADKRIVAIGVAVPGPYFSEKGMISSMTEFPGWEDIPFQEEMAKGFSIPVIVDHDSNAGALAEWWLATNEQLSGTLVYIGAGDGIGAGILHDGAVFRGAMGIAGEIGHASINKDGPVCECGNRGCLTNYVSTPYMAQRINGALADYPGTILKRDSSFFEIVEAINKKDPLALYVFRDVMGSLSIGIINVICAYGPNEIIISDRFSLIGESIIDTLMEMVTEKAKRNYFENVTLRLGSFTKDSSFIGAAALAIDYCFGNSNIFERSAGAQA
ncbi:MAG: ROK family transcriptional regulator [Christensenellaceae bacterium]|nr:ROK family transcriptional regulator [Christensenellaceae bacterium]